MPSFKAFIEQAARNFPASRGNDGYDFEEEVGYHVERMLENVHLGTIRIAFPDIEDVAPELKGVDSSHPAFQAAIEVAIRDAVVKEHFGSEEALEERKASGPGM